MAIAALTSSACAKDLDTSRSPPARGTIGEELFGVICDRVAAQAIREDLTGASYQPLCHKDANGQYADTVDQSILPQPTEGAVNQHGDPVSLEDQQKNRDYAVHRVESLAHHRADLIEAFDFTFPDMQVPVKDIHAQDPTATCAPASGDAAQRSLGRELADMLGRLGPLYDDGTIPQSTESLARFLAAFQNSKEAQTALERFAAHSGYRPANVALGVARPTMAYPRLRDLSAETLRVMSADSNPLDPNPPRSADGKRIPVPGPAYAQLSALLEATHQELRVAAIDPPAAALTSTPDVVASRNVLSRPRGSLEVLQTLLYASDPAFGGNAPSRYIVRRDARGFASVPLVSGGVPAPFVDKDGDKLPDLDAQGRFITSNGQPPPSPFLTPDALDNAPRDQFGRVTANGALLYDYLDTSHTFTAQMMGDMRPLVDPDPTHNHETVMNALSGAYVIFGARTGDGKSQKSYAPDPNAVNTWSLTHVEPPPADLATRPVVLSYNGYDTTQSPMLDLVYALGQILGDPTTDDTLAFTRTLVTDHTPQLARLIGDGLVLRGLADKHPEAANRHAPGSTFWDEILDQAVRLADPKDPAMLEDLLKVLGDDNTPKLAAAFANFAQYGDHISYDRGNLNGPAFNLTTGKAEFMKTPVDRSKPDTGLTRSAMQRFLQAVNDTAGVTACNKPNATVHAKGIPVAGSVDLPISGSYKECQVFKIENLAKFYLDSIAQAGTLTFRPAVMRNGIVGIGAATVDTIQQSSGIIGFYDPPSSKTFRPQPQWLNRLVNFDLAHDSVNSGDKNYTTNHFLKDLQGLHIGTAVCPERSIPDPCIGSGGGLSGINGTDCSDTPDIANDGMIHGLRTCQEGDWLDQRDPDATMVWEDFNFYSSMAPLVKVFVNHQKEDVLIAMMVAMFKHWQDDKGTPNECAAANPKDPHYCAQDGLVTYEPLLSEIFASDFVLALHDLVPTLTNTTIKHCTTVDKTTHKCTATTNVNGITVLAQATRALLDPGAAKTNGLTSRLGRVTGLRNDGTTNPQVTPMYLMTEALNNIDATFAAYAQKNPNDNQRQAKWRLARSQLVDQFLGVTGNGTASAFTNPAVPKMGPTLIDLLREQIQAHCPDSFVPPYPRCGWARDELTQKMTDTVKGPVFAGSLDLLDAVRKDDGARREAENLLVYMLDTAAQNDALPTVLASSSDLLQIMEDDTDIVPILHVAAEAAAGPLRDAQGNVVQSSMMDSQAALLARLSGRAFDAEHHETCSSEIDPNQVLTIALKNMVTPLPSPNGTPRKTPLEVIMDAIGDVNRVAPERTDKYDAADYANITAEVGDFLLNKERGLEQFYEIVRQGTE